MTAIFLLHHLLQEAAIRHPDNEAVILGEERITFQTLNQLSNSLGNVLSGQGLKKNDRVVLCLRKSIASLVGIHGTLKAGGCYVPVDPDAPPVRCGQIIRDSGAAFLLSTSDLLQKMGPELVGSPLRSVVLLDDATAQPSENRVVTTSQNLPVVSFEGARESQDSKILPNDQHVIESDTACVYYTSGSTGTPKGVMRSHRSALSSTEHAVDFLGLTPSDRIACQPPLHFAASSASVFGSVRAGAALVLIPEGSAVFPSQLAKLVESHKVTIWISVPSVLTLMALYGNLEACDLSHLRTIVFGGEAFPPRHLSRLMAFFSHARFVQWYASSESFTTAEYEVKSIDSDQVSPIPIGKATQNAEIFAINVDGRMIEKPGEKGELYVRGPTVMQGYWGDPERTARSLVKNPLRPDLEERVLKTGDIVTLNHEGNYVLVGREDGMVKSRGNRVELGEVEATMYAHPSVKEVAVVPMPDDVFGSRIIAFVSLQDGSSVKQEDILAYCSQRLPRYMVPSSIEFRALLPRMSNEKIDKVKLISEGATKGGAIDS